MSDPDAMDTDQPSAFTPFTIPERIQQLNEIDKVTTPRKSTSHPFSNLQQKVTEIMHHTSKAMTALSPSGPTSTSNPEPSTATNRQTFKDSMDAFVTTLHYIDVHLKRQILGLEEAGIIDLSNDADASRDKSDVRPTALGTVGGLDMGWLNSRGDRVEREMDGELWQKGRRFLEGVKGEGQAAEK